ncbi:MAG: prepilin-type N-terminal cleavage/methylation domain-containing protein [bacterium]|nr:prepilin-type N-terminal cleavage/methylation domain-containing protein [bacterium]MDW8087987.1 prepilin-type N-terminal cleavage/methylation domain-containing protein [Candidatus Calescibacterium sp.]
MNMRAFTLLELLVSIAIISFSVVVLFGIVLGVIRSGESIQKGADREATMLFITYQIKRELESVYFCPGKCGVYLEEMGFFGRPYDRLIFTTLQSGLHQEIEYSFEIPEGSKEDVADMIKRVDREIGDDFFQGGYPLKILDGVKEFDVKIFANGSWHERWSPQDGPIQFIQISGAIKYGNSERRFRMFVEPMAENVLGTTGVIQRPQN